MSHKTKNSYWACKSSVSSGIINQKKSDVFRHSIQNISDFPSLKNKHTAAEVGSVLHAYLNLQCMLSYGVFVHEAPDSSCNLAGEQDDQAGEELRDRTETLDHVSILADKGFIFNERK